PSANLRGSKNCRRLANRLLVRSKVQTTSAREAIRIFSAALADIPQPAASIFSWLLLLLLNALPTAAIPFPRVVVARRNVAVPSPGVVIGLVVFAQTAEEHNLLALIVINHGEMVACAGPGRSNLGPLHPIPLPRVSGCRAVQFGSAKEHGLSTRCVIGHPVMI